MKDFLILLLNILIWLIIIGAITVLHELGHAVPALIFTSGNVTIKLGYRERRLIRSFGIGRLRIEIYPYCPFVGAAYWNGPRINSAINRIIMCFGGPFISIVCAVLSLIIWNYGNSEFMLAIGMINIWHAIMTLIPVTYPKFIFGNAGMKSDGRNILDILLKEVRQRESM